MHESSANLFVTRCTSTRFRSHFRECTAKCSRQATSKKRRTIFPHVPPNWTPDESSRPQRDLPLDPLLAGIWAGAVWPSPPLAAEGSINCSDRGRKHVHASTRGMHLRQTHLADRLHLSDRIPTDVPLTGTHPVNDRGIVNPEVYACPWSRVERSSHYSDTHRASGNATRVRAARPPRRPSMVREFGSRYLTSARPRWAGRQRPDVRISSARAEHLGSSRIREAFRKHFVASASKVYSWQRSSLVDFANKFIIRELARAVSYKAMYR